jgi:hypothetical protein
MRIILTFIFIGINIYCLGQNYIYPNDTTISDSKGIAKKYVYYFPTSMFINPIRENRIRDKRKIKQPKLEFNYSNDSIEFYDTVLYRLDKSGLKYNSKILFSASEPILFNSYIGFDVYRFTWLRSFHPDIVIRLIKSKSGSYMVCKKLKRETYEVDSLDQRKKNERTIYDKKSYGHVFSTDSTDHTYETDDTGRILGIWKSVQKTVIDTVIYFDKTIFDKFDSLVIKNEFIDIPNKENMRLGADGSTWLLELHKPDSYWVVSRWSPNFAENGKFRILCEYLIENSIFRNEKRY